MIARGLSLLLVLFVLLPAGVSAAGQKLAPRGPAPVAGTDYDLIEGGRPFAPAAGRVEVAEVFGYGCPACARFEPMLAAWKAKLPADVTVTPVAAPFGGAWIPFARAYYTAQALGAATRTHARVFLAIHEAGELPRNPNEDELATFYAGHGVPAARFAQTYGSAAIDAQLERARAFIERSGVDHTPTLVVQGKYRVHGESFEDMLRIAEHLIARERAARPR